LVLAFINNDNLAIIFFEREAKRRIFWEEVYTKEQYAICLILKTASQKHQTAHPKEFFFNKCWNNNYNSYFSAL
jgi:hypothetical protein